jgi:hypothetical protein
LFYTMSVKVMAKIWEAGPPQQGDRFVLLAIADHANDEGEAFPGVAGLARKTCMSERGIQKILRRLEAGGWLVTEQRQGRYHCNLYTVMTPNVVHRVKAEQHQQTPNKDAIDPERSSLDPEHGSPKPSLTINRNIIPQVQETGTDQPEPKDDTYERLYGIYPRKVAKGAALKAIQRALKKIDAAALEVAVREFAAAVAVWPKEERQFVPHPATWFNGERWKDDRSEWKREPKKSLTEQHQPAISFA